MLAYIDSDVYLFSILCTGWLILIRYLADGYEGCFHNWSGMNWNQWGIIFLIFVFLSTKEQYNKITVLLIHDLCNDAYKTRLITDCLQLWLLQEHNILTILSNFTDEVHMKWLDVFLLVLPILGTLWHLSYSSLLYYLFASSFWILLKTDDCKSSEKAWIFIKSRIIYLYFQI